MSEPRECQLHGWYFEETCLDCDSGLHLSSDTSPEVLPIGPPVLVDTLSRTVTDFGHTVLVEFKDSPHKDCLGIPSIEITEESCQDAALRFRGKRVAILNFASATSPGGGVRFGAHAQEESLCLTSGLLHCLESNPEFYKANEILANPNQVDRALWSTDVPLIRNGDLELVEPMRISVLTYAAPNLLGRRFNHLDLREQEEIRQTFNRRCRQVVDHAARNQVEVLILGAWGCGAFGNAPHIVASAFKDAVSVSGSIETLVFAVFGGSEGGRQSQGAVNRAEFRRVFGNSASP